MKLTKTLLMSIIGALLFIACTSNTTSDETSAEEKASVQENCTYSYVADSTKFQWTAYKFSSRAGVGGTFNSIEVSNTASATNPLDVLKGAEFVINTSTVNSGNQERDPKLVSFFFNALTNTENITGKIKSIDHDNKAAVLVTMNEKTVEIIGKVTVEGEKVSMEAAVNMNNFDGMSAIASLNEVCSAQHTGEDGDSKLWPDVSIVVSTILKKECK